MMDRNAMLLLKTLKILADWFHFTKDMLLGRGMLSWQKYFPHSQKTPLK